MIFFVLLTLTFNVMCIGPEMPFLPPSIDLVAPIFYIGNQTLLRGEEAFVRIKIVDGLTIPITSFIIEVEVDADPENIPSLYIPRARKMNLPAMWKFNISARPSEDENVILMLSGEGDTPLTSSADPLFKLWLGVATPWRAEFRFLKAEANGVPCLAEGGVITVVEKVPVPVPVPYKTEEPRKSTETCSKGQVSVDGKCVAIPSNAMQIKVGGWIEYYASVTKGNHGTVTFSPNEWEVGQVRFSEEGGKAAEGCSLTLSGVWDKGVYRCNGYTFILDPKGGGVLTVAMLRPKVEGVLKILFTVYGPGWTQELEVHYLAVLGSPAMAPGTTKKEKGPSPEGKSLFKWGGVKRE
ncbi:MAG: hypothetical protein V1819_03070 [bacterium]